jgi:hypothetical protein
MASKIAQHSKVGQLFLNSVTNMWQLWILHCHLIMYSPLNVALYRATGLVKHPTATGEVSTSYTKLVYLFVTHFSQLTGILICFAELKPFIL